MQFPQHLIPLMDLQKKNIQSKVLELLNVSCDEEGEVATAAEQQTLLYQHDKPQLHILQTLHVC